MNLRYQLALLVSFVFITPSALVAQTSDDFHPYLSDRFHIGVGVFFPKKSYKIRVDGSAPEEEIDFDEVFGFDDDEAVGSMSFRWRFGRERKWSLWGQYWSISDSDGGILTRDVEWENVVFKKGTFASAGIDQKIARVFLGREFFTEKPNHEFGLGLGLHWMSIDTYIEGQLLTSEGDLIFGRESVSADMPLPNIGAWYAYSWNPKWMFQTRLDWLDASVGNYSGGLWNGQVGIHWQAFKNFGFGLYYNGFVLDVDVDKDDWRGAVESRQHGPWLAVSANW